MLSGPPVTGSLSPDQLLDRFLAAAPRQRRSLLRTLDQRQAELTALIPARLATLDPAVDDWLGGCLIQLLLQALPEAERLDWLNRHANGWLAAESAAGIAYGPLERHLMLQEFEAADRLTSSHLRQLAGPAAEGRGYVYYSEVPPMPALDLRNLDRLWVAYSRGRFGFSVQGRLLQASGGRWEQLWPRLGWKSEGVWTRYPGSFQWTLEAPEGHMPLTNQLRGVRLMDALLQHPALAERIAAA